MSDKRYLFHFNHGTKVKTFGPHEDWTEAKMAFQFRYGYWPEELLGSDVYEPEAAPRVDISTRDVD